MSHTLYLACTPLLFWFGAPGCLDTVFPLLSGNEGDYTTYYDLLFLIVLGDNTSLSKALN